MAHIVPMLTERIRDQLELYLKTLVDPNGPVRASIVKVGRFQDSPKKHTIYVTVQGGKPGDDNYIDGVVTLNEHKDIGLKIPRGELGTSFWYRKGVVQFGVYVTGDEDVTRNYAYEVLGKICYYLKQIDVSDMTDDYGETAYNLYIIGTAVREGGGPKRNYTWRGEVLWACLTERS